MTRLLACLLASLATLTAATMAAVAAWDRGGTALDRALLVALSVAIVAGVHLIPALSTSKLKWLLWAGCLLGTVYGHLVFFVHAGMRAGEAQAQQSAQVAGTARQIEAVRNALAGITARPVTVVAAQLARTHGRRERAALRMELAEAERAAAIRDKLSGLEAAATEATVMAAEDPVTARLAAVTGITPASISLAVGLLFALLLELLGALLWVEALRYPEHEITPDKPLEIKAVGEGVMPDATPVTDPGEPVTDAITRLRAAVNAGTLKPTVAKIREYLGCGTAKAMELRRALNMEGAA